MLTVQYYKGQSWRRFVSWIQFVSLFGSILSRRLIVLYSLNVSKGIHNIMTQLDGLVDHAHVVFQFHFHSLSLTASLGLLLYT